MTQVQATAAELHEAWQRLMQRWQSTRALWNDPVARSFEKEHWTPLEQQTRTTQQEMERLAQVIAKARRSVK